MFSYQYGKSHAAFYIFLILIGVGISKTIKAQQSNYNHQLQKQIILFHQTKNHQSFKKLGATFKQLADVQKNDWLPYYYAATCYAIFALESPKDEIDNLCQQADKLAKTADSLYKNNSEVLVLKSMICAARILVNQQNRAHKYGVQSLKYANEAIRLDSENPRAYLLKAQNILNTPKALGGGKEKALPIFKIALDKYNKAKTSSPLYPHWGKQQIEDGLENTK